MKRQMDASAPPVKIQGWVGWNAHSSTPSQSTTSCPRRILTGTISGLDSRSCALRTQQASDGENHMMNEAG